MPNSFGVHRFSLDPVRQWKLSPTDIESLDEWDAYTEAKEEMFQATDTDYAPWIVVKSNDKKRARVTDRGPCAGRLSRATS